MTWQPSAIVYPDAVLLTCQYLPTALGGRPEELTNDVFVSNRVPSTRRERMVIVRRDGGRATGLRDRPRLSLRVWAPNDEDAIELAGIVRALLAKWPNGDPVLKVEHQSGPTDVADESGHSSALLVVEVHTRGVALT